MGLENLENDSCRNYRDEEKNNTILHLLGRCPVLCLRRNRLLGAYYFEDLHELSGIAMDSFNGFIESPGRF